MVLSQTAWSAIMFAFGMTFAVIGFIGYFKKKKRDKKASEK